MDNTSILGKKVVVYDIQGEHAKQNGVFKKQDSYSGKYLVYLYEECLKKGIQILSADMYLGLAKKPERAICVRLRSDLDMSVPQALKRYGVKQAVLGCAEHPLVSPRFYWKLGKITSQFDYSMVMSGVKDWISPKSRFLPWYTPHPYRELVREVPAGFRRKKFIALIQSNLRAHILRRLYVNVMNFMRPMPNFERREGYKSRLEAIKYFSQYPDFDLYGFGWDKPVRYTHRYDAAIRKSYRGVSDDKLATLQQYKFSLCFEGAYLGGYVQYLIDALYAGAVPVYWGAPDITDIFPANCFIDFRKFGCNFDRLHNYLRHMDEGEYNEYIENINRFIASPRAYELSQENYAKDMIRLFESYF